MKKTFTFLIFLFFIIQIYGQGIVINEFMSDNQSTIQDEDGDFSDWIELYNNSDSPINLFNYSLSDDITEPDKWTFPNITLNPHSFLLVFASSKNRLNINELHTNFKIKKSGEEILISNSTGEIISYIEPISLQKDNSYGCIPDGSLNFTYLINPSPNNSNSASNELSFSNHSGFYTSPFFLKIHSFSEDTIHYTLNGSLPTINSALILDSVQINYLNSTPNKFSEIPTSPEQDLIDYKAWESPNEIIDKATIIRCASFKNGIQTSKVYTKSFFVDNNIMDKYTIPVISLVTDSVNLFSQDSGIYVPGKYFNSNNPQWTGNYFKKGIRWERPVHIEYFENNGHLCFSQNAGIRIHGGKTRQAAQKSLRLYARNEYGSKYFNYQLMPQKNITKYKRFLLRTSMGAWGKSIIKDVLAQNIASNLNIEHQDFRQVIVYINGEYWGIHAIRDRIDERYISYTHNIDKDSIEFLSNSNMHYNNLINFIKLNDLSSNNNYEYVKTQIDINNYIDYTISELFFSNYDWPANNLKLWHKIPDGKWRWILYDIDAGFGNENYNMLKHTTKNDSSITWPNSPKSTFLFRNLLKNASFKNTFLSRYAEILNNEFSKKNMQDKYYSIKKIYTPELHKHINRWGFPSSYSIWETDLQNTILDFIINRPCSVEKNILEFFNITKFEFTCNPKNDSTVTTTDHTLFPNPNNGLFYIYNNSTIDINNAQLNIINITGQTVYKENINILKNKKKFINLNYLPNNTYILNIKSKNYSEQLKMVIIH